MMTGAWKAPLMLPHHEAGVKLGMLAAQKGTNPQIKQLGQGIVEEQAERSRSSRAASCLPLQPGPSAAWARLHP